MSQPAGMMRAVGQRRFGGPEVLEPVELRRPSPMVNDVLVRVHAAGVNPIDARVRAGDIPFLGEPPFTLGWDVSGTVVGVFPGVTRFAVGDEVCGMPLIPRQAGCYAEFITAPARQLVRKPAGLSHQEAAGLPLAGLTAWQALVDTAGIGPGTRVLVHAGGGGVGHLAIQLAKARGAEVVTTASAGKHALVRELGADQVIDYRSADFTAEAKDVDVVLDTVGGETAARSFEVLRPDGLLVSVVEVGNAALAAEAARRGLRFAAVTAEPDHVGLAGLALLVEEGRLRVHVGAEYPLAEAARAHELIDSGSATGKIVLTV